MSVAATLVLSGIVLTTNTLNTAAAQAPNEPTHGHPRVYTATFLVPPTAGNPAVAPQAFFGGTAACKSGYVATGGGYSLEPNFPSGVYIFHNAPNTSGWEVDGHNESPNEETVTIFAQCLHLGR